MTDEARPAPSAAVSVRVRHLHRKKYDGQRRHDLRVGPQPGYVDQDRADRNRTVIEPPRPGEMRDRADERRRRGGAVRAMREDAAVATVGVITFGAAAQPIFEKLTPDQQDRAYREVADRIAHECDTTVRGLVVHGDEAAPHAHVTFDSRSENGAAMSKIMKGSRLQDIAAEVMSAHAPGIVRGERKVDRIERGDDASAIYHRSVQELHHDLPHELSELRADRDAAAAKLEKNERLAVKAREKADGDDAKAEKARKRAETYEKRVSDASDRIAALDRREADLQAREKVLHDDRVQVDAERVQLDERRAALDEYAARLDDEGQTIEKVKAAQDAESKRLRDLRDQLTAAYDTAKQALSDVREARHLPRDVRKSLRDGIQDLRDALKPPKKQTERDRINDQIVSQPAPDKSRPGPGMSGPE